MRIIAKKTLRDFWVRYPDAEEPLQAWYRLAKQAEWATPAQVKEQFRNASIIGSGRVVFNIAGNKYRLVVAVRYDFKVLYVRFVGTHRGYDRINAEEV